MAETEKDDGLGESLPSDEMDQNEEKKEVCYGSSG